MSCGLSSGGFASPPCTQPGFPHTEGTARTPRTASRPMNLSMAPHLGGPAVGCTHFQLSRKRLVRILASAIPWMSWPLSVGPWTMPKNSERAAAAVDGHDK